MLNIRIYGFKLTDPLGIKLERLLQEEVSKTPGWEGRHVSPTIVDSRSGNTLRLDVVFINRIGLEPEAIQRLKTSVMAIMLGFLNRNRAGHPFRRVVVRMQPTPPEFHEFAELEETS